MKKKCTLVASIILRDSVNYYITLLSNDFEVLVQDEMPLYKYDYDEGTQQLEQDLQEKYDNYKLKFIYL